MLLASGCAMPVEGDGAADFGDEDLTGEVEGPMVASTAQDLTLTTCDQGKTLQLHYIWEKAKAVAKAGYSYQANDPNRQ